MVSDNENVSAQFTALSVADAPEGSRIPEEERVKLRAAKRDAIRKERKRKAEEFREKGNRHFMKEDYDEALKCYMGASLLDDSNPVYLCNEAAVNLKLGMYHEAECNAQLALDLEPRNMKARYRRAIARKALGKLRGAKADFLEMLKLNPDSADAKLNLAEIKRQQSSQSPDIETWSRRLHRRAFGLDSDHGYYDENGDYLDDGDDDGDVDSDEGYSTSILAAPGVDSDPESIDSFHSHTSDYMHEGNGIPCHGYNHDGCERGKACEFSHAPDLQSLRDDLGKNVCLRFAAGECPFEDQCVYSHVEKYLPTRKREGPWTKEDAAMELSFNKKDSDFDEAVYDNFREALDTWKTTGQGRRRTKAPGL